MLKGLDTLPIYSPASGTVLSVNKEDDRICISIFTSVLDDNIQYSPIDGVVTSQHYDPGSFLSENENLTTQIHNNDIGYITIKQISGIIFKRIYNYVQKGQIIKATQPIGNILLGSRVDICIYALKPKINVKNKDYIYGGKTVIGTYIG